MNEPVDPGVSSGMPDAALPAFSDEPTRAAHQQERSRVWRVRRARLGTALWISLPAALLFGALVFLAHQRLEPSPMDSTRNQAFEIGKAAELYKLQTGAFPERLDLLVAPPRGKQILLRLPTDEWGHAYLYELPGRKNAAKFDVRSAGEDGVFFTDDDIGNWPEDT
jgi:hypothetical protein